MFCLGLRIDFICNHAFCQPSVCKWDGLLSGWDCQKDVSPTTWQCISQRSSSLWSAAENMCISGAYWRAGSGYPCSMSLIVVEIIVDGGDRPATVSLGSASFVISVVVSTFSLEMPSRALCLWLLFHLHGDPNPTIMSEGKWWEEANICCALTSQVPASSHLILMITLRGRYHHLHFWDEKSEACFT